MPFTCCSWCWRCCAVGLLLAGGAFPFLLSRNVTPRAAQGKVAAKNDVPTFGGDKYRNMVNTAAKNVPTSWHVEDGKFKNIKWAAKLGSRTYGGPVIVNGRIFVGTNNDYPRDKKIKGARAVLMCFDAKDGKFLWQVTHPMPPEDIVGEATYDGLCSTPTVEGGRIYYVTPSAAVICASVNDGKEIWRHDMHKKYKVYPNFLSNCSPLIVGDALFVVTGNGTDFKNKVVAPEAPSFLALKKKDGSLIWKSNLPGKNLIEGQWGNPAYAKAGGVEQILFPGGDSWLYSLEPKTGKPLWKFHCNPKKQEAKNRKRGLPNYLVSTPAVHKGKVYIGVGLYPAHPIGNKTGHFWCIDLAKATKLGKTNKDRDVSIKEDNFDPNAKVNKDSAMVWHFGGPKIPRPKFGRSVVLGTTISTASVQDGLVYIPEERGFLHCLDANTGKHYWEHDFRTGIWGSALWVDNKVYLGNEDGDVIVFAHGKQKKVLTKKLIYMEDAVQVPPVVANGTLYITTKTKLYAIGAKK